MRKETADKDWCEKDFPENDPEPQFWGKYIYLLEEQKKLASLGSTLDVLPRIKSESEFIALEKREIQVLTGLQIALANLRQSLATNTMFMGNLPQWVDSFHQKLEVFSRYIEGYLKKADENYKKCFPYYLYLIYLYNDVINQFASFQQTLEYYVSKQNPKLINISENARILNEIVAPLTSMPLDIIQYIFNFLDLYSLKSFTSVNKQIHSLRENPSYILNFFRKGHPQEVSILDNGKAVMPKNQRISFRSVTLFPSFGDDRLIPKNLDRKYDLFFDLVKEGNLVQIKNFLLKNKILVDPLRILFEIGDDKDYTPIHWASFFKHQHLLDYFYTLCCDYCESKSDAFSTDHNFKIKLAIVFNQLQIVRELISPLSDLPTCIKSNAFAYAAEFGYADIVQLLIDKGAKVGRFYSQSDEPLHLAVSYGHLDVVKILLNNFANLCQLNSNNNSLLEIATFSGHTHIVDFLLNNFLNIWLQHRTKFDYDCLRLGIAAEHKNILNNALTIAAQCGFPDIVNLLLDYGSNVNNQCDCSGYTPLVFAAENGHYPVVEILIRKGADTNFRKWGRKTVLAMLLDRLILIKRGKEQPYESVDNLTKVIDLLIHKQIEKNINIDALKECIAKLIKSSGYDGPMIHCAVIDGNIEVVNTLAKLGYNLNSKDQNSLTPLDYAVYAKRDVEMIKLLIANGADVKEVAKKFANGDVVLAFLPPHPSEPSYFEIATLLGQSNTVQMTLGFAQKSKKRFWSSDSDSDSDSEHSNPENNKRSLYFKKPRNER